MEIELFSHSLFSALRYSFSLVLLQLYPSQYPNFLRARSLSAAITTETSSSLISASATCPSASLNFRSTFHRSPGTPPRKLNCSWRSVLVSTVPGSALSALKTLSFNEYPGEISKTFFCVCYKFCRSSSTATPPWWCNITVLCQKMMTFGE